MSKVKDPVQYIYMCKYIAVTKVCENATKKKKHAALKLNKDVQYGDREATHTQENREKKNCVEKQKLKRCYQKYQKKKGKKKTEREK